MASVTLMAMPVQAQEEAHGGSPGGLTPPPGYTNWHEGGSAPLPAGVTPSITLETLPFISFRPNPVGIGQPILVNLWMQPPIHVARYFKDFTVTLTMPDGTTDIVKTDSYRGDGTGWFEYVVNQVGTWKIKFAFIGAYYPAGNYSVLEGAFMAPQVVSFSGSCYYKPSSTAEYEFVVQQDMAASWPPSPLPTDYWTRPVSPENREWWPILGAYPPTGIVGGGPDWPAETNTYMSNYNFFPYVQAPKSAHILWRRQGDLGGLVGSVFGQASYTSSGGSPSLVYSGRCYQSVTKVLNGVTTTVWQCYDLRTGEVYWERTGVTQLPTAIFYGNERTGIVPGGEAFLGTLKIELLAIGNGRIVWYDPYTGSVDLNVSISPFTTGTYYDTYPYFLTVQNLGGNRGYRLINWTLLGTHVATGYVYNYSVSILNNITWPFSSLGTVDYQAGVAVNTAGISAPETGVMFRFHPLPRALTTIHTHTF